MTKNLFYAISDGILKEQIFADKNSTFTVFSLIPTGVSEYNCSRTSFDSDFLRKDGEWFDTIYRDNDIGGITIAKEVDNKKATLFIEYDNVSKNVAINMETSVTTPYTKSDEFGELVTTYTTLCESVNFDFREDNIYVIFPSTNTPPFVIVSKTLIADAESGPKMADAFIDVLSGLRATEVVIDSRNCPSNIEKVAKKNFKGIKLDSPAYSIKGIPEQYKDEFIEYDEEGNVSYYRNDVKGLKYTRSNKGDLGIEEDITISDTLVSSRLTITDDDKNEKIIIDTLNGYAHVVSYDYTRMGMILIPDGKSEYEFQSMFPNRDNSLNELEDRAIAIMQGLTRPTITYSDELTAHQIKYSDGRYVLHYTDGKISTDIYYNSKGEEIYKIKTFKLEEGDQRPYIDNIDSDVTIMTIEHASNALGRIHYVYRIDGIFYEFNVNMVNNFRVDMTSYISPCVMIACGHAHNRFSHGYSSWTNCSYIRGAFGVPHKYSTGLSVEEIL